VSIEILKEPIDAPAQNNLTWVFRVRLDGGKPVQWMVDDFDLSNWFREVVGRYPRHEFGDRDELDDVRENWEQLEPKLRREAEKQAELGVKISVDGVRISALEWEGARSVPVEELPPLTQSQREVARKMNVPELEYSRNFLAAERGRTALLDKTERLARFLREQLRHLAPKIVVRQIALSTIEQRFDVDLVDEGTHIPVRIREEIVDDFFEGGSSDAESRIIRVLESAIKYGRQVVQ